MAVTGILQVNEFFSNRQKSACLLNCVKTLETVRFSDVFPPVLLYASDLFLLLIFIAHSCFVVLTLTAASTGCTLPTSVYYGEWAEHIGGFYVCGWFFFRYSVKFDSFAIGLKEKNVNFVILVSNNVKAKRK